jgi:hypothetical protein
VGASAVDPVWNPEDSEGCSRSGSAQEGHSDNLFLQCVTVAPRTTYFFGSKYKGTGFFCNTVSYADDACQIGDSSPMVMIQGAATIWSSVFTTVTTAASTHSMWIVCDNNLTSMDQIYFNTANKF